jgi:hypothetical protein
MAAELGSLAEYGGPVAYPASFKLTNERWTITIPGLRNSDGALPIAHAPEGTEAAAARGLLEGVLSGLIENRMPIVAPAKSQIRHRSGDQHERIVPVKTTLAMKALLWETMRRQQIEEADVAATLKCTVKEVRRLLDPNMESRDKLADALDAVGRPIAITMIDPSAPNRLLRVRDGRSNAMVPASAVMAPAADVVEAIQGRSRKDPSARQVLVLVGRRPSEQEAKRMETFRIRTKLDPILVWMTENIRPKDQASYLRQHVVDPDRRFDLYARVGDTWIRRGREI